MISNRYKEESDYEKDNDADCFPGAGSQPVYRMQCYEYGK